MMKIKAAINLLSFFSTLFIDFHPSVDSERRYPPACGRARSKFSFSPTWYLLDNTSRGTVFPQFIVFIFFYISRINNLWLSFPLVKISMQQWEWSKLTETQQLKTLYVRFFLEHGSYVLPVDHKTATFLGKSRVFTKAHWLTIRSFCAKLLGNKKWLVLNRSAK